MKQVLRIFRRSVVFVGLSLIGALAYAADIAYISSSSGFMLHNSGGGVTANWQGQARISGFGGYGQINISG